MIARRVPLAVCVLLGIVVVTCALTAIRIGVAHGDTGSGSAVVQAIPPPLEARTPAPPAAQLHNPVTDPGPALDDVQAARKLGWPVALGAIVTMLALALGTAGARVSWLSWLARGSAATALGALSACGSAAYDAAMGGGSATVIAIAVSYSLIAFWKAHRPPAPALEVPSQRGSVPVSLLAWLCSAVLLVGGGMLAWSCSGAQRRSAEVLVVDCTIGALAGQADAARPAMEAAIRTGDWAAVRRLALELGVSVGGCAAAGAISHLLEPQPASLTGPSGPAPATLRAGWERLRGEALGGRRFVTQGGLL